MIWTSCFGENGESIARFESTEISETFVFQPIPNSNYFFEIIGKDRSLSSGYSIKVDEFPFQTPFDRFEPNDTIGEPTQLANGDVSLDDLTIHDGDSDFFRWSPAETGEAVIDLIFGHQDGDLDLRLWQDDEEIGLSESTDDNEQLTFVADSDANYVIQVFPKNAASHPNYQLILDGTDPLPIEEDDHEPNNSPETATSIGVSDVSLPELTIHSSDDVDFFLWTPVVSGPTSFDVTFNHDLGDVNVTIWVDGDIHSLHDSADDNESFVIDAEAGRQYLIEIFGEGDSTNPSYSLDINAPKPPQVEFVLVGRIGGERFLNLFAQRARRNKIPWRDVDRVKVKFTKDVTVDVDSMELSGLDDEKPPFREFSYDADLREATWKLSSTLPNGQLSIRLSNSISDVNHNLLDGEINQLSLPSGNGIPGGDLVVQLDVVAGDFNGDQVVDDRDIDLLGQAIRSRDPFFDLDGDDATELGDLFVLVEEILNSRIGDSTLDGIFDSSDMVTVFQAGEYEDDTSSNSTWAEGDWNLDGEFDSSDLVFGFQFGRYSQTAAVRHRLHPLAAERDARLLLVSAKLDHDTSERDHHKSRHINF